MSDDVQARMAAVWNSMDASWESYGKILEDKATMHPERVAVITAHERLTYAQLDARVNRVGNAFAAMGVCTGDKVCVMLPNSPEFLYTWWGNAKLGGVTVPLNTALKGEGLAYIINHSDAETLVLSQRYLPMLAEIRPTLSHLKRLVVLGSEGRQGADLPPGAIAFGELLTAPATSPLQEVWSDDIESIMYTSGTTGLPKGVIHRHARCYGGFMLPIMIGYTTQDVVYNTLPLFHIGGQNMVWMALVSDTPVILAERFSASRFWHDVRQYHATVTLCLGAMIPILHKQPPQPDDHDNPLRVALSAAAPRTIWEAFEQRFHVKIVELYAQTEGGFLLNTDAKAAGKVGSMGKASPVYEVKVVDAQDRDLPPGTVGELIYKPASGTALTEYYKNPDATAEKTRGGWVRSGDLAYQDEDGYFFFVDRKNDFMRRRGENISSFEVEKIIDSHPQVLESAAYAIPSELGEDDVMIALVLQPGAHLPPEDLMRYCEAHMAYFMIPRYVRLLDALPKTGTERTMKYQLQAQGVTHDTWDREMAGYTVQRQV
ncbi:MAG: ATP-dependent acyl-CoA ligase [Candidatus Tectomicrobia bacterium]|uniref:ATP-dependent acyl-CoA ligase n=1 Tax=Tectimicrobiota bacterium TaxID=2528274 RepID=A0A938B2K4_UNCTE|nr:ATP-dependent acyl-CoA ligase [Candidatus Tectomicrobia bacterium]